MNRKALSGIWLACSILICTSGLWLAANYCKEIERQQFRDDSGAVEKSFAESIRIAERILLSISNFIKQSEISDQVRLGEFAQLEIARDSGIKSVNVYELVTSSQRSALEAELRRQGLAETILHGGTEDEPETRAASSADSYLPIIAVNTKALESSYVGWDLTMDADKHKMALKAIAANAIFASPSFLLENGHAATELFLPWEHQGSGRSGVIGLVVDLTNGLGNPELIAKFELKLSTKLAGDEGYKDVFRQLVKEAPGRTALTELTSSFEANEFDLQVRLIVKKILYADELDAVVLWLTGLGLLVITVLMRYLLFTYLNLLDSRAKVILANKDLERRVDERTRDLASAHRDIREILDNVGEVVLTVTPDLVIGSIYSPATKSILGVPEVSGLNLKALLFGELDKNEESASRHLFSLAMLHSCGEFQWSINKTELLQTIRYKNSQTGDIRTLACQYSPIFQNDKIQKMIVVAADVTEVLRLQAENQSALISSAAQDKVVREVLKISRSTLADFLSESEPRLNKSEEIILGSASIVPDSAKILLRELHTIKGAARTLGLKFLSHAVHILEDALEDLRAQLSSHGAAPLFIHPSAIDLFKELRVAFALYVDFSQELRQGGGTGERPGGWAAVSHIQKALTKSRVSPQVLSEWLETVQQGTSFAVDTFFHNMAAALIPIAQGIGKDFVPHDDGAILYLPMTLRPALSEALTHVLRNAIDHGLESTEQRLLAGKEPVGNIRILFEQSAEGLTIIVEDDGRGIDVEKVYAMAAAKGIVTAAIESLGVAEIIELLFHPGFSTSTEISELSGRGVGLDAVRAALAVHQIECRLLSRGKGLGSEFQMYLPLKLGFFISAQLEKAPSLQVA